MQAREAGPWRVLRVDLSTGTLSKETLDPKVHRQFVGGNGVALKYLYDEVPAEVEPYAPENRLIFSAGPLGGTVIPGGGTFSVATKGPMTGGLVSAQANGFFGARMRHAGFDTIIVEGVSSEWKYLYINNGEAKLESAEKLLGLSAWATEDALTNLYGGRSSVACIGPSGENLVRYAAICCDHGHVASSNGPGGVMGSKRLKAVVAHDENQRVAVYDLDSLKEARRAFLEAAESSGTGKLIKSMGTSGWFEGSYKLNALPVKNYTTNEWSTIERYYGDRIRERYERKRIACWRCPWAHCSEMKINDGAFPYEGEEPEFEHLTAWTMNIGNDDFAWAVKLANINDSLGMDVKECTYAVALAIECYESGLIDSEDTGGLELTWGNPAPVAELLDQIAHRRGFGAILADGVKAAAERIGGDALDRAVYMGMGLAPHVVDGRGRWSLEFNLMLSDTGSFSGSAAQDSECGVDDPIGLHDAQKMGRGHARVQRKWLMHDSLGTCLFFTSGSMQPVVDALNAATGWDMTVEEYLRVGERIAALSRAFNVRNGITMQTLLATSPRFTMPQHDGPFPSSDLNPEKSRIAEDFYRAHGWDPATGKPLPETLVGLGLEYMVPELWGQPISHDGHRADSALDTSVSDD